MSYPTTLEVSFVNIRASCDASECWGIRVGPSTNCESPWSIESFESSFPASFDF